MVEPDDVAQLVHDDGADVGGPFRPVYGICEVRCIQCHLARRQHQRMSGSLRITAAAQPAIRPARPGVSSGLDHVISTGVQRLP